MTHSHELVTATSAHQAGELLGAHPNADATVLQFPALDIAPSRAISHYQDVLTDWSYGSVDLAEWVRKIRCWSIDLWDCFFSGVRCPEFYFRFEHENHRVLGHYMPGRNDAGLRYEISINPRHFGTRSERQIAAVLLHEEEHACEELLTGKDRAPRNGYHSAWFRRRAEEFGIPCTRYGAELGIVTPSRFTAWADEHGLRDDVASTAGVIVAVEPLSKRVPWVCECPRAVRVTVQVPRGGELLARCERCGARFERKEVRS